MCSCQGSNDEPLPAFEISFAFQPILDLNSREIFSYEALVRGNDGSPAGPILAAVRPKDAPVFDQICRTRAIALAAMLGNTARLNINFSPNAVYDPIGCLSHTIATAEANGLPLDMLILEVTETDRVVDPGHLSNIIRTYREMGVATAIDDFGNGYAGLSLLAEFQPDYIKLDMGLVRDVHLSRPRQAIVRGINAVCRDLNIGVVAEGIERAEELDWLTREGIHLVQGYLIARPAFECLPALQFSAT